MANTSSSSSSGIGFFGLLTVLFIGLKLTGYVNWSWWLVLLPAYGGMLLIVAVLLFIVGGAFAITVFEEFTNRRRSK